MNFSGQLRNKSVYILCLFLVFFTVSCSSDASDSMIAQVTPVPLPTPSQPVEYGASLDEWEEATQNNPDEVVRNDNINTEQPQAQETSEVVTNETSTNPTDVVSNDNMDTEQPQAQETSEVVTNETNANPTDEEAAETVDSVYILNDVAYQNIMWDRLVPADYTANAIMAKYEDQIAQLSDNSPEAADLYAKMQEEFNNAPVNEALNETLIRLPGFIAPLEYTEDLITEFLLVPYFGACIHVPPPPANQTVLVKTAEGQGIKFEDSYQPFWIIGKITTQGATTELAQAGFYMEDAITEPYSQ